MKTLINKATSIFFHHSTWAGYWETVVQAIKPSWRDGYYRARVKSVSPLDETTLQLILSPQKKWPSHCAGQHISITLEINGKLVSRVFTIASGQSSRNTSGDIRLIIRTKKDGALTPYLGSLSCNDWVNISAPMGNFLFPNESRPGDNRAALANTHNAAHSQESQKRASSILMIAGGSGITPFVAMLDDMALMTHTKPTVHLLYFAKENEHLLTDELEVYQRKNRNFTYRLLSRQKDGDVENHLAEHANSHWMVCGPQSLYEDVARMQLITKTPLDSEHFAAFPTVSRNDVSQESDEATSFSLTHNGNTLSVNNQQTLLEQLLEANQPVTYGCGMGICHQCQCVKKRGVVRDTRTGALSDSAEQLIQLCVSQAVTDLELQA